MKASELSKVKIMSETVPVRRPILGLLARFVELHPRVTDLAIASAAAGIAYAAESPLAGGIAVAEFLSATVAAPKSPITSLNGAASRAATMAFASIIGMLMAPAAINTNIELKDGEGINRHLHSFQKSCPKLGDQAEFVLPSGVKMTVRFAARQQVDINQMNATDAGLPSQTKSTELTDVLSLRATTILKPELPWSKSEIRKWDDTYNWTALANCHPVKLVP